MTIPRSEIVREFVLAADNSHIERVFTVTEAADVAERLIARAVEAERERCTTPTTCQGEPCQPQQ